MWPRSDDRGKAPEISELCRICCGFNVAAVGCGNLLEAAILEVGQKHLECIVRVNAVVHPKADKRVHMPANLKHSIKAKTPVVMLLVLLK